MNKPIFPSVEPFFKSLGLSLPLLVGLLYIHGGAFRAGYLQYWGLSFDMFQSSFEDTLALGAFSYLILAIYALLITPVFSFLVFMVAHGINDITKIDRVKIFLERFGNQVDSKVTGHHVSESLTKVAWNIFKTSSLLFVLLMSILAMSDFVSEKGKESAQIEHSRLANSEARTLIQFAGKDFYGHIIQCGAQFCAVLVDSQVLILPSSAIQKISRIAPELKSDLPLK